MYNNEDEKVKKKKSLESVTAAAVAERARMRASEKGKNMNLTDYANKSEFLKAQPYNKSNPMGK